MTETLTLQDLRNIWPVLSSEERGDGFSLLSTAEAMELFLEIGPAAQADLLRSVDSPHRAVWIRLLAPDDAADLLQQFDPAERGSILALLDDATRREVNALLAYADDVAGGRMSPRFARVRADMSVGEAMRYLRRQASAHLETLYYAYVLDDLGRLVGVFSFRELFRADDSAPVSSIMKREFVTVRDDADQESVARVIAEHDLLAVPVLDASGVMKGIVTVDDIVDVVQEEATEDFQKVGGTEALDAPYLETGFLSMVRKRAGWLAILFVGEMLTASAMGHFEDEISKAVVLAVFIPLIISSGGNSGSQASTLVIRALSLGHLRLTDWYRVFLRELRTGFALGLVLASIGAIRILIWQQAFGSYGEHWVRVLLTVSLSLVGIVLWGSLSGAMLPFILRRLRFDPASASAPFVATLVDVSGLVLYFTIARWILGSTFA